MTVTGASDPQQCRWQEVPTRFRAVFWALPHPFLPAHLLTESPNHCLIGLFHGGKWATTGTRSGTRTCADSAPHGRANFPECAALSIGMGVASAPVACYDGAQGRQRGPCAGEAERAWEEQGTVQQGGRRTGWQAGHQTCPAPRCAGVPTSRCYPSRRRQPLPSNHVWPRGSRGTIVPAHLLWERRARRVCCPPSS